MKALYTTDKKRFTLANRLKAYGMAFLLLVQVWMPASAAVIQSNIIEREFNNNPEFQRVFNALMHQFSAPQYQNQNEPLGAQSIAEFLQVLETDHPTTVDGAGAVDAKFIGTPIVQARYLRSQIQALLGRQLIDADDARFNNEIIQLNTLYSNALLYLADNPGLIFGQTLSLDQENNGYGADFIWPELRRINGESVLVPIVYFSEATFRDRRVDGHEVQFNGEVQFDSLEIDDVDIKFGRQAYLNVVNDLVNDEGGIYGEGDLQIVAGGTLRNISGAIDAVGNLKIKAHSIESRTIVHRWDYGSSTGGQFGEVASLSAGGDVVLRSGENIVLRGSEVKAADEITFAADGSIYIGGVPLSTTFEGNVAGWQTRTSSVDYLGSTLSAENTINLIANGQIVIDASEILSSKAHIDILAGMGITVEDELNEFRSNRSGKFGKTTAEESVYKTVAMRSVLDAGLGLRLHTEFGDVTLKGAEISTTEGASVSAANGAINMLMAIETDHYQYNSVTEKLFTVKTVNRGHEKETGIPNAIIGGFKAEALYGLNIEYEGDPNLPPSEQIEKFKDIPSLSWMYELKNPSSETLEQFPELADINWNAIELVDEYWNESKTSLSPAAMAVIAIVITVCTAGAAATVVGPYMAATVGYAGSATLSAAFTAGFMSLVTQVTLALANGAVNGDISGALKELENDDTWKSIAIAMVTAGVLAEIDADLFTVADNADLSIGQQVGQALTHSAVNSGVSTIANGGDLGEFGDQFIVNLAQHGINVLGEHMAGKIGKAFDGEGSDPLDTAMKYISHAASGCIIGAASAGLNGQSDAESACYSGGGGAVIGEFIGSRYRSSDKIKEAKSAFDEYVAEQGSRVEELRAQGASNEQIAQLLSSDVEIRAHVKELDRLVQKGVDLSKLGAALGAFVAGADAANINTAAWNGANAAENNAFALLEFSVIMLAAITVYFASVVVVENISDINDALTQLNTGILHSDLIDQKHFERETWGRTLDEDDVAVFLSPGEVYYNADGTYIARGQDGLLVNGDLLSALDVELDLENYSVVHPTDLKDFILTNPLPDFDLSRIDSSGGFPIADEADLQRLILIFEAFEGNPNLQTTYPDLSDELNDIRNTILPGGDMSGTLDHLQLMMRNDYLGWKDFENDVIEDLQKEYDGIGPVAEQVTLTVNYIDDNGVKRSVRIRPDSMAQGFDGEWKIVEAKYSRIFDLSDADFNINARLTTNQREGFRRIANGDYTSITASGERAGSYGVPQNEALPVSRNVELRVNSSDGISSRHYGN